MNTESLERHFILIVNVVLILFFTYCAIPIADTEDPGAGSKIVETDSHSDGHESAEAAGEPEIAEKEESSHAETSAEPSEEHVADKAEEHAAEPVKVAAVAEPVEAKAETAAATSAADIIAMNNPLYESHKKGIVQFTHKKHVETYSISCGDCHHDEAGKPLALSPGDAVQNCIECHKGTDKPKGEKLGKKEKIAKYHFEALHANCIGCHKEYNIEKGDPKGKGPAPTSCTKCHPKA